MKPKRRAVTSTGRPPATRRTPTVRRVRPAIVSAPPKRETPANERTTSRPSGPAPLDTDTTIDLSVDLGRGLVLANPILVASGTFGYGVEYGDVVDVDRLGAICCKGTTLRARIGNPTPRVTETPGGMLNSIGLQNPGVDAVIEKYAGTWTGWKVPVIVNVAGESVEDYVEVTRRLDGVPGVAGIELNISCPNVGRGGLQFAIDAGAAAEVTAAVRRATDMPLLVKLSPNVADIRPIAKAIADAGADALTAINTLSGIAVAPGRTQAAARQHLRRAVRPGDQAGRAPDRLRGGPGGEDPGRRDRRRHRPRRRARLPGGRARSRSRSAPRSSPTRRFRSVSSTSSPPSAASVVWPRTGTSSGRRCPVVPARRPRRAWSTAPSRTCTWYGMCMFSERTQVLLSPAQVEKLKRIAARDGRSVGAVIRDAVDTYIDPGIDSRRRAVEEMLKMNAPVDDWEVMKAQILKSQFGDW